MIDLRKPSLHKRLEVDNISGISNYLVNSDMIGKNTLIITLLSRTCII